MPEPLPSHQIEPPRRGASCFPAGCRRPARSADRPRRPACCRRRRNSGSRRTRLPCRSSRSACRRPRPGSAACPRRRRGRRDRRRPPASCAARCRSRTGPRNRWDTRISTAVLPVRLSRQRSRARSPDAIELKQPAGGDRGHAVAGAQRATARPAADPPAGQRVRMPRSLDLLSPVGPRKQGQSLPAVASSGFRRRQARATARRRWLRSAQQTLPHERTDNTHATHCPASLMPHCTVPQSSRCLTILDRAPSSHGRQAVQFRSIACWSSIRDIRIPAVGIRVDALSAAPAPAART